MSGFVSRMTPLQNSAFNVNICDSLHNDSSMIDITSPSGNDSSLVTIHNRKSGNTYPMRGVNIQFPHKAYPCQVSLMSKMIQGLVSGQYCLLESPTGTGKTLALLCASIAWQRKCYDIGGVYCPNKLTLKPELVKIEEKCTCEQLIAKAIKERNARQISTLKKPLLNDSLDVIVINDDDNTVHDSDEELSIMFSSQELALPNRKKFKSENSSSIYMQNDDSIMICDSSKSCDESISPYFNDSVSIIDESFEVPKKEVKKEVKKEAKKEDKNEDNMIIMCPSCILKTKEPETKETRVRPPRIFYGTRTHKQIAQVVRELKKTAYESSPMTILSSRERTCIHPEVSKASNKNDKCREMVKGKSGNGDKKERCEYYRDKQQIAINYSNFRNNVKVAWDLEDLVNFGTTSCSCPFYGIKTLHKTADIIFCPYNYLIDPMVRKRMDINVKNAVIIFDEAHNLEDICRDSASMTLTLVEIEEIIKHFDDAMTMNMSSEETRESITVFRILIDRMRQWIKDVGEKMEANADFRSYEEERKEYSGMSIIAMFKTFGITAENIQKYRDLLKQFDDESNESEDGEFRSGQFKMSSVVTAHLETLINTVSNLFAADMRFVDDYKGVIVKKLGTGKFRPKFRPKANKNGFYATQRNNTDNDSGFEERFTLIFNLWCFNPEIAFNSLHEEAHCVIVSSGTLTPMESFQSELNADFRHILEASHVIESSQIWSGILSKGPQGIDLNSSYENSEKITFQDEVGRVIQQICETVPHGILVFFPSYAMMAKLKKRWQITGQYKNIERLKYVFEEPRGGSPEIFDSMMKEYFDTIESFPNKGALLFGVCRGKISEGIDFADNQARAVVTIGIPFPNYTDAQVTLKKKYNDERNNKNNDKPKLLPGGRWYEIQAFRAINQAFGRCIRHRDDWGAILLIDSRFNNPRYQESLSKWMRQYMKLYSNSNLMHNSLKNFIHERKTENSLCHS